LTPESIGVPRGMHGKPGADRLVININCAFGFWADVPIPFLHICDESHPVVYIAFLCVVGNCGLNAVPYLALRALSNS
jgi:hypothetical protein